MVAVVAAAVNNRYCCGATTVLTATVKTAAVAATTAVTVTAVAVVAMAVMTEAARNRETADGDIGRAAASDSRRPTDGPVRRNNRAFAPAAGIRAVVLDVRDGTTLSWKKTVAAAAKKTKTTTTMTTKTT